MNTLDAIFSRRSIRKFTSEPIENDIKEKIIRAGFCAPSAMNARPWHFLWLKNPEKRQKLTEISPYVKFFPDADAVLVVCGDKSVSEQFWTDDCAAAVQNILLAATELGVGSCWCAAAHTGFEDKISALLELPENIEPYAMIALGYSDSGPNSKDRYDASKVHDDKIVL